MMVRSRILDLCLSVRRSLSGRDTLVLLKHLLESKQGESGGLAIGRRLVYRLPKSGQELARLMSLIDERLAAFRKLSAARRRPMARRGGFARRQRACRRNGARRAPRRIAFDCFH